MVDKEGNFGTDTLQKDSHIKAEVETGVILSQTKEYQAGNFQMTGGRHGTESSLDPSERAWSCKHLYFGLLATRTERINSYCLRPLCSLYFVIDPRKLINVDDGCGSHKTGKGGRMSVSLRESFPCPKHHARYTVCVILILTTFEISSGYFHILVEEIPPGVLVPGLWVSE